MCFFTGKLATVQNEILVAEHVQYKCMYLSFITYRPAYAYRSDPRNMSTLIDPQYVPGTCRKNEFLTLLLNVYNPGIPLLLNVTPEETMAMYETLFSMRAQKQQTKRQRLQDQQAEQALYGGSMNPIPADWYVQCILKKYNVHVDEMCTVTKLIFYR